MHLIKAVLMALLISIGVLVAAAPQQKVSEEKVTETAIELMPSVFDSLGQ